MQQIFDRQTSIALLTISQILSFTVVIWFITRILYTDELEKKYLTENIERKNMELENKDKQLTESMQELKNANEKIKGLLEHENKVRDIAEKG